MPLEAVRDPLDAGNAPRSAGIWTVDGTAGTAPQVVFRRVLTLRFPDPGTADRVVVDAAPVLRGRFLAFDYDALAPDEASQQASLANGDEGTVVAELDGPRRVIRAAFAAALDVDASDRIDLFRLDGDVLAPEPSFTVRPQLTGASPFEVVQAGVANVAAPAGLGLAAPSRGPARFAPPDGFTDQRFALRLRRQGDTVTVRTGDVTRLTVRGLPTAPRLGLAPVDRPDEAVFFWRIDGQPGGDRPAGDGTVAGGPEAAEALRAALQTALDDAVEARRDPDGGGGGSGPLELALVIESDQPCRFRLDQVVIDHVFELASFTSGEPKQTLRFSGQAVETQAVPIALPADAEIRKATARVKEALDQGDLAGGPPAEPPRERHGRLLTDGRSVEQSIQLARATEVAGIALALLPLAPATEVVVELVEDHLGQATGRVLGELVVSLDEAALGHGLWAMASLDPPAILTTTAHWLVVRTGTGAAVWLRASDPPPTEGTPFTGGYRLLSTAREKRTRSGLTATVAGQVLTAGPLADDGSRIFDLAAALRDAGGPVADPIALTLTAASAGLVTVYPPRVRYTLPG